MVFSRGGQVHVYTGHGKGKSTAAFGLALRMAGQGGKVLIVQFMKERLLSGEAKAVRNLPSVTLKRYGLSFVTGTPVSRAQIAARVAQGIEYAAGQAGSGDWDMIVLDEAMVAAAMGLVPLDALVSLLKSRDARTEIVLTGRDAPQSIIDMADLVTEMCEIKHPFQRGLRARKGIEY